MSNAVRGRPRRARAHGALDRHRCWLMCWVYLYVTGTARTSTTRNAEKLLIYLRHKRQRPSSGDYNASAIADSQPSQTHRAFGRTSLPAPAAATRTGPASEMRELANLEIYQNAEIGCARRGIGLSGPSPPESVSATPSPQGNHSLGAGAPCARGCSAKGARSHGQSFPLACATLRLNESKYSCGRLCMRT